MGCFFAMQLFVGVVIEQFNSIRMQKDGSATMTAEQRQWADAQKSLGKMKVKVRPVQRPGELDAMLFAALGSRAGVAG